MERLVCFSIKEMFFLLKNIIDERIIFFFRFGGYIIFNIVLFLVILKVRELNW